MKMGTIASPWRYDAAIRHALIPTCRFEDARCGYINRNGDTVIMPQFDWVDLLAAGRALVKTDGKYGAIDATGRFVIAPVFTAVWAAKRDPLFVEVGRRHLRIPAHLTV